MLGNMVSRVFSISRDGFWKYIASNTEAERTQQMINTWGE